MNTQTTIADQIADEQDNRAMQQQAGQHALSEAEQPDLVVVDTLFDIPAPINALAWALRSAANNALWNCMTTFLNKDRKPATLNAVGDMPDYLQAMLADDASKGDNAGEPEGAIGLAPALVRSSWMVWAEAYKALLAECLKVSMSVGIPLKDSIGADGKIQRGMASYLRTPMQEAERRSAPKGAVMDETEARVLIPARFQHAVKEGVKTVQQRALEIELKRNTEAAKEIDQYVSRCDKKIVLHPHEAYSFLNRFKDDFEQSLANDLTKPRLMEFDGTLKDDALAEMALADGLAKTVELEMQALVRDHGDSIIVH